jgi:hypothetical protein
VLQQPASLRWKTLGHYWVGGGKKNCLPVLELRFDHSEPFPNFDRQFPLTVHLIETLVRAILEGTKFRSKRGDLGFETLHAAVQTLYSSFDLSLQTLYSSFDLSLETLHASFTPSLQTLHTRSDLSLETLHATLERSDVTLDALNFRSDGILNDLFERLIKV